MLSFGLIRRSDGYYYDTRHELFRTILENPAHAGNARNLQDMTQGREKPVPRCALQNALVDRWLLGNRQRTAASGFLGDANLRMDAFLHG